MHHLPPYESQNVEFKAQIGDNDGHNIKKTLVAFANTFGGDLYIGIRDDGSVYGVEDAGKTEERLWNMVRDNVFPSIIGSVEVERLLVAGKTVLHVHVDRGPTPPYSLAQDDPRQVFVRVGNTSAPARIEDISQMIARRNPVPFEKRAAAVQDLTFSLCMEQCRKQQVKFEPKTNINFGFWDPRKNMWTNLAFICSDQGQSQMILVQFRDDDKTAIVDSERISGSIFLLMERAQDFVSRSNYLEMEKPTDGSLARTDHYRVNPDAVREAIVNQLAHRDYSKDVPCTIHISPSKIEFWSVGGAHDLLPEDILENMATSCRNPMLAALLTRLKLMEGLGTGYRLIQTIYRGIPLSRLVQISENSVKISLPRRQALRKPDLGERQRRIVDTAIANGQVTRQEVQALTGVSQSAAVALLQALVRSGVLVKTGGGPRTAYILSPDMPLPPLDGIEAGSQEN
jgi:ATP-dependent DNA helicase RecG